MSHAQTVGFIGLGHIGVHVDACLCKADFDEVVAYDLLPEVLSGAWRLFVETRFTNAMLPAEKEVCLALEVGASRAGTALTTHPRARLVTVPAPRRG